MVPEYKWLFWKRVLDIVCVFTITCIQLPYPHCVPRGVHRVWMSLFCVKDIVCFHVLVNDLVIRVSSTDTGAIPCICTSGSVGRGAMHWIDWKRLKQPGHAYMMRGMHHSALWYMCYDYMHVWYCFYVQLTWSFYMFCTLSKMAKKRWVELIWLTVKILRNIDH